MLEVTKLIRGRMRVQTQAVYNNKIIPHCWDYWIKIKYVATGESSAKLCTLKDLAEGNNVLI